MHEAHPSLDTLKGCSAPTAETLDISASLSGRRSCEARQTNAAPRQEHNDDWLADHGAPPTDEARHHRTGLLHAGTSPDPCLPIPIIILTHRAARDLGQLRRGVLQW
jgi:hypothetical protein